MTVREELLRQLRFTSGQLKRRIRILEAIEQDEKNKLLKAILDENIEEFNMRGEIVLIRESEAFHLKLMASKIDDVYSKLPFFITIEQVNNVRPVLKALDRAVSSNNILRISLMVYQFERQFEDLDICRPVDEGQFSNEITFEFSERDRNYFVAEFAVQNHVLYRYAHAYLVRACQEAEALKAAQARTSSNDEDCVHLQA